MNQAKAQLNYLMAVRADAEQQRESIKPGSWDALATKGACDKTVKDCSVTIDWLEGKFLVEEKEQDPAMVSARDNYRER